MLQWRASAALISRVGTTASTAPFRFSNQRIRNMSRPIATSAASASPMTPQTKDLADRVLHGERLALAKAITLVESTRRQDQVQTSHLIGYLLKTAVTECARRQGMTLNDLSSAMGVAGEAGAAQGDDQTAGAVVDEAFLTSETSPVVLDPTVFCATERQKELNANFRVKTFRIGISGPPGTGKSTFIEAFGKYLTSLGHKVAVIAVDPSSVVSGGSILGDKTRMIELARDPNAFIRPSPNRGSLGGVTTQTYEIMTLCECAGFDIIIVETVGVGQSEIQVTDFTDMLVLLVPPAGGDDLQGIKKGIVEMSDLVVVNKADGDLLAAATATRADYAHALSVLTPKTGSRRPQVTSCSALTGAGIPRIWELITEFRSSINAGEELRRKRREQRKRWMWRHLNEEIIQRLYENESVKSALASLQDQVATGIVSPRAAADRIINAFVRTARLENDP